MILNRANIDQIGRAEGFTILINKPQNWTSFDVVNKLRYALKKALGKKKIKVGHAGTLDPLATGLLIICVGKQTKEIYKFQGLDKVYEGEIRFGGITESGDLEMPVSATFPTEHISEELIKEKMKLFVGDSLQVPPVYSALKKGGVASYKLARQGKEVSLESRNICIEYFDFLSYEEPDLKFSLKCGKGTYVRSLAVDLGKALNSGAHLKKLNRTAIGPYKIENAWELEELIGAIESTNHAGSSLKE